MSSCRLLHGDALDAIGTLPDESAQMCVTSPPYWGLRDYGEIGQMGLEATPEEYVKKMVAVFREVRRVLKKDGTLWLNLGDCYARKPQNNFGEVDAHAGLHSGRTAQKACYARPVPSGLKAKDLVGIPWMVAFALRADGWYLRSDIIWSKPNPMPESILDRPTKSHEYLFLLSKSARYFYDFAAIMESATDRPTGNKSPHKYGQQQRSHANLHKVSPAKIRNKRTVWTIASEPYKGAHFATYPSRLVRPCVLAGSRKGDVVLDPFNGAGTSGLVALAAGRSYIGIDVSAEYLAMTRRRLGQVQMELLP